MSEIDELKRRISELEDGSCRFNCRTEKQAYREGYKRGYQDGWDEHDNYASASGICPGCGAEVPDK